MCCHNICVGGAQGNGYLFLSSGGPFDFDPFDTSVNAVPDAEGIILGETGCFKNSQGTAKIKTMSRAEGDGRSVIQMELRGKNLRPKD
jgi:hypothetical protein